MTQLLRMDHNGLLLEGLRISIKHYSLDTRRQEKRFRTQNLHDKGPERYF
jgi:hypothetical protein